LPRTSPGPGLQELHIHCCGKGLEEESSKGGVTVLPLFELGSYQPIFVSTVTEMEYLNKLIAKYSREGEVEFVKDLDKLRKIFEMEQS